jgi:hypothetical protein
VAFLLSGYAGHLESWNISNLIDYQINGALLHHAKTMPNSLQGFGIASRISLDAVLSSPITTERLVSDTFAVPAEELVKRWNIKKEIPQAIDPFQTRIEKEPNQTPETTILSVTDRAPSSTPRAREDRVSP